MLSRFKTSADAEKTVQSAEPATGETPEVQDVRSQVLTRRDRSAHRRHAWLYEDLLN